jgi:hypothetical protein
MNKLQILPTFDGVLQKLRDRDAIPPCPFVRTFIFETYANLDKVLSSALNITIFRTDLTFVRIDPLDL